MTIRVFNLDLFIPPSPWPFQTEILIHAPLSLSFIYIHIYLYLLYLDFAWNSYLLQICLYHFSVKIMFTYYVALKVAEKCFLLLWLLNVFQKVQFLHPFCIQILFWYMSCQFKYFPRLYCWFFLITHYLVAMLCILSHRRCIAQN